MKTHARIIPPLVAILSLCSSAALAQTPTPTWPGGGSCGSPNVNCIPAVINGNWAALRRMADQSNSELACYDPANVAQTSCPSGGGTGCLTITMNSQSETCYDGDGHNGTSFNYTSDMMMTYPFNFLYGTVEARIKFGRGWPAFWMLGGDAAAKTGCQISNLITAESIFTCNWSSNAADSAEIDIAEFTDGDGYGSTSHHVFINGTGHDCGGNNIAPDAISAFHTYRMTWSPGSLSFTIDGGTASGCTTAGDGVPVPSHPMFLMINDTLSNSNSSVPPSFPQVTTVDYVRVWDQTGNLIFDDEFGDAPPAPTPTPTPLSCASGSLLGSTKLSVANNSDPPGDERLSLSGAWQVASLAPAIDPVANGFYFEVLDQNGATIFQRQVPGGMAPNRTAAGWRVNRAGTRWTFVDPTGSAAGGITRVTVSQGSAKVPGQFRFTVKGRKNNFQVAASQLPVQVMAVLGGAAQTAAGQCAKGAFNAMGGTPPACTLSSSGDILRCR